jgi:hypothetical protein
MNDPGRSAREPQNSVVALFNEEANPARLGHPNPSVKMPGLYEEYHPELSPDTAFLERFIETQKWRFASTMPKCPHWYVVRGKGPIEEEFVKFVHHVRSFGYDDRWYKTTNRYLDLNGFRYWTMGFVMSATKIINRCKLGTRAPHPFRETPQMFFAKAAPPGTEFYSPN